MINTVKSYPAPSSLEIEKAKAINANNHERGKYNLEDVLIQLEKDFKKKCYLCETKATSFEVEHLVSHRKNIELKFKWDNLFLSCRHCNNIKSTSFDEILDCTKEDVETHIKYKMDLFPMAEVEISATNEDERVLKTVELLDKCFNGEHTPTKKLDSKNIRDNILKQLNIFRSEITKYFDAIENDEEDEIQDIEKEIRRHLNNNSEYASFKRCIVKYNPRLNKMFGHYIPAIERGEQDA